MPSGGVVIGRDAGCDVVIGKSEVSRRHAEIASTDQGYFVRDMSSNGVFVNGERVKGSHRLARADVIRIGSEEFRFYADMPVGDRSRRRGGVETASPRRPRPSLHGAARHVAEAVAGRAQRGPAPLLATLEVLNEGLTKGNRYTIRTPLAHVGRGASQRRAPHRRKRQRDPRKAPAARRRLVRGGHELDERNVRRRIADHGERQLEGAPDVRFGGVKLIFLPRDEATGGARRQGDAHRSRRRRQRRGPQSRRRSDPERAPLRREARSGLLWWLVALAVAAAAFIMLRGRA